MKTEERQLWAAALVVAVITSTLISGSITALAVGPLKNRLAVIEERPGARPAVSTTAATVPAPCGCSEEWRTKADRTFLFLIGNQIAARLNVVALDSRILGNQAMYSRCINEATRWYQASDGLVPPQSLEQFRALVRQEPPHLPPSNPIE